MLLACSYSHIMLSIINTSLPVYNYFYTPDLELGMASIVANCNYMINQSVFGHLAVMP